MDIFPPSLLQPFQISMIMIYPLPRKKEIDRMLMEMLENLEKPTEDDKEQENGTDELDGVEQEESNQEDDDSSEVRKLS